MNYSMSKEYEPALQAIFDASERSVKETVMAFDAYYCHFYSNSGGRKMRDEVLTEAITLMNERANLCIYPVMRNTQNPNLFFGSRICAAVDHLIADRKMQRPRNIQLYKLHKIVRLEAN